MGNSQIPGARTILSGAVPLALLLVTVLYLLGPGSTLLDLGVPLPEVTIEKVDFVDNEIRATIRNTGPIPVVITLADINDRIHPAAVEPDAHLGRYESALVRIPFEWNQAEPYTVGITTGDGTRFERKVEAAAPAPVPGPELVGLFAAVGALVGVVPVMIGLMWLPFIRKLGRGGQSFFLALTAGLLLFLGIDSIEEALAVASENLADSFNGALLSATVVVLSFLGLYHLASRLTASSGASAIRPAAVALMIAVGIGLHNFGEGLAIGAAVGIGSAAFGAFLIVGFAIHNTTEGVAIAAPIAHERPSIIRLASLGAIAGVPAIFGTWAGGFAYSPIFTVVFLSVGAGAIFQVILVLLKWIRNGDRGLSGAGFAAGFSAGMVIMYLTGLAV